MKKKSALIASVALVLVAVLALTTATFAWFTTSMNPKVEELNVQVTTSNALLIGSLKKSTDAKMAGIDFKTTKLLSADIKNSMSLNKADAAIPTFDVTTPTNNKAMSNVTPKKVAANKISLEADGTVLFSRLKDETVSPDFSTGHIDDDTTDGKNIYADATNNTAKQDFITFDLFLKSNFAGNSKVDVALDVASINKSVFKAVKVAANTVSDATLSDDGMVFHIAKALRVAFVSAPITITSESDDTLKLVDGSAYSAPIVYQPDALALTPAQLGTFTPAAIDSQHKNYSASYGIAETAEGTLKNQLKLFTMDNNSVSVLRVYIWLEGNDADAINAITGGMFQAALNFIADVSETAAP